MDPATVGVVTLAFVAFGFGFALGCCVGAFAMWIIMRGEPAPVEEERASGGQLRGERPRTALAT
jgi:hypothetical protein